MAELIDTNSHGIFGVGHLHKCRNIHLELHEIGFTLMCNENHLYYNRLKNCTVGVAIVSCTVMWTLSCLRHEYTSTGDIKNCLSGLLRFIIYMYFCYIHYNNRHPVFHLYNPYVAYGWCRYAQHETIGWLCWCEVRLCVVVVGQPICTRTQARTNSPCIWRHFRLR